MLKTQQPVWIERLDEIRLQLRSLPDKVLNRQAVELIFGISRRAAIRLMQGWGAAGSKLVMDRAALLEKLKEYQQDTPEELERRTHFAAKFLEMRRERLEKPAFRVAAPAKAIATKLDQLLEGGRLKLEPGKLTLTFESPEECVKTLLLLGMALNNDYARFEELVQQVREEITA